MAKVDCSNIEVGVKVEYLGSFTNTKTINVTTGGKTFPSKQKDSISIFSSGIYAGYSYKF